MSESCLCVKNKSVCTCKHKDILHRECDGKCPHYKQCLKAEIEASMLHGD